MRREYIYLAKLALGLLVITYLSLPLLNFFMNLQVTYNCVPKYNICGNQQGTLTHKARVDIFNDTPVALGKIGLTPFLQSTEYARILWWPQSSKFVDEGKDRIQIWQAKRIADSDDFEQKPYAVFDNTEIMMLYSSLMTLISNIQDMTEVRRITGEMEDRFKYITAEELKKKYGLDPSIANNIAILLNFINKVLIGMLTDFVDDVNPTIRDLVLPHFTAAAIKLLNEIDKNVEFQDYWYLGLPMDNSADDVIVPVMWTETWVPLTRATDVTSALRDYFKGLQYQKTKEAALFERTGNNGWELYATKPSTAWLSMAYTNGSDEWSQGAFRVDPYWWVHNSDDFRDLYRPIWKLLKNMDIPFRLHWAKSFPLKDDHEITADDLVTNQYPRLADFLALRAEKDPNGIFLNSYWSHWLGIAA